jgi:hypothetical protein
MEERCTAMGGAPHAIERGRERERGVRQRERERERRATEG